MRLGRGVLLVERSGELSERLSDAFLVFLGEEGGGTRSPEELLEGVDVVSLELLAFEIPDGVAGVGLARTRRGKEGGQRSFAISFSSSRLPSLLSPPSPSKPKQKHSLQVSN